MQLLDVTCLLSELICVQVSTYKQELLSYSSVLMSYLVRESILRMRTLQPSL